MQVNPLAPENSGGSKGKGGPLAPCATCTTDTLSAEQNPHFSKPGKMEVEMQNTPTYKRYQSCKVTVSDITTLSHRNKCRSMFLCTLAPFH